MPIYEYERGRCGNRYEHQHAASATRDEAPPCPSCGSKTARRVLSSFSVGKQSSPGSGATCCGAANPSAAGCGGGSCCGKGR
ncbi:MAG TPA: zinc ribbon domain-containing protein [bacterium]|nr:MAG: Zinc ribbon domain protein [bacterium ADurb.Bin236]HOY63148.1 zinc ribbon domain-containing protein [bacterium]HPI75706.1 zinc ribbon domain-containing protein [bacterium]HPN94357.1 zinc ribbon domain-containing protein [bacterium]